MPILTTDAQTASFIINMARQCNARIFEYRHRHVTFADFKDDLFTAYIETGLDLVVIDNCHFEESAQYPSITVANEPQSIATFMSLHSLTDIAEKYNLSVIQIAE